MAILVTGGAGYIGSHTVEELRVRGASPVVVDDFSAGHHDAVARGIPVVEASIRDTPKVKSVLREFGVRSILHFAGKIQVAESVQNPQLYYAGNVVATASLLEAALEVGVRTFVFSSTAAVYGMPSQLPFTEKHPTAPINPYGETKLAVERMLEWYHHAYGLNYLALRYFNAAGAHADAGLGERHDPESHVIPLLLQTATGQRERFVVYGNDYETPDGTCVRDYIHVRDLADAHIAAVRYLEDGGESGCLNLGTGQGYSVQEVLETARRVTQKRISVSAGRRREGDPAVLVADPSRAQTLLGWQAKRSSLEQIVADAWHWYSRQPFA